MHFFRFYIKYKKNIIYNNICYCINEMCFWWISNWVGTRLMSNTNTNSINHLNNIVCIYIDTLYDKYWLNQCHKLTGHKLNWIMTKIPFITKIVLYIKTLLLLLGGWSFSPILTVASSWCLPQVQKLGSGFSNPSIQKYEL